MSVSEPINHPNVPLKDTKPTYTWKTSVGDWFRHLWSKNFSDAAVENRLLSHLPFYPQSDGKRVAQIIDTDLGDGNLVHEFLVENIEQPDAARSLSTTNTVKDIVLVHGYAASLGLFLENFSDLSSIPGVRLHAIDLPGFGFSSRPKYPNFSRETKEDVFENEDWFIDRLEQWRKKRGIERFVLIGHSFGGYLSCAYAMKYNTNLIDAATGVSQRMIEKLVLVSPVGVERHDKALTAPAPGKPMAEDDELPNPIEEVTRNQEEIVHEDQVSHGTTVNSSRLGAANSSISSNEQDAEPQSATKRLAESTSKTSNMLRWLWDHNCSPFSITRNIGPARSKMVSMWTSRRFSHVYFSDPTKFQSIHDYFYRVFNGAGSGEYAITRVLVWGALARLPLLDRCPQKFVKMGLPTLWLYGDNDWMDGKAGLEMTEEINQLSRQQGKGTLAYYGLTPSAGHHLYLDNPKSFSKLIFDFLNVQK